MSVQILETGVGKIVVRSPYHPDFAPKAKRLGGKWDAGQKAWIFDARDEQRVRDLCTQIYGTDGAPLPRGALVTIRATPAVCDVKGGGAGSEYWLTGRLVARVTGRDSGARLGDGVVLLKGAFHSGGSMKNYTIGHKDGTTFELRDVPRAIAEKLHAEYHGVTLLDADGNVIAEATQEEKPVAAPVVDTAALELEIAAAEGRLAGLRFKLAEARAS